MSRNQKPARRNDLTAKVNRRRVIQATGGAAGAIAVGAPLHAAAQETASPEAGTVATPVAAGASGPAPASWDQEADVVVVGTGAAAFSAAVTARDAGAEVLMLEKADSVGGTTFKSAGGHWIPNNHQMRELGLEDPREDAIKYMVRLSYPSLYDPDAPNLGVGQLEYDLIATYYDTGSVAAKFMADVGALQTILSPGNGYGEGPEGLDPDYSAELPENMAPYGRQLSPDGDVGGGVGMIQQFQAYAEQHDIPIQTSHRVVGVFQNDAGEVVGVRVDNNGEELAIGARRGVVFGSGGFTQSPDKALHYLRGPIFGGCAVPTNTGDFIDIGTSVGARLGNMNHAFWVESIIEDVLKNPSLTSEPWMLFGDSMVLVNKYGERVVNEKTTYNERTQAHFYWGADRREYSNLVMFMIYDDTVAQDPTEFFFRYPVPMPNQDRSYVIKGDTWEDLAANISDRLEQLRGESTVSARINPRVTLSEDFLENLDETITTFNGYAEDGVDPDFRRGKAPIETAWGSAGARRDELANPTMAPFAESGPYYAIMLGGGTLDTNGGPIINPSAQVLHVSGEPIPGLYGAGNCVASPAGQAYWSGGGTLGPAITYGYIAGKHAAGEPDRTID